MRKTFIFLAVAALLQVSCTGTNSKQEAQDTSGLEIPATREDSLLAQKIAPYVKMEKGKYVFDFTEEKAKELGLEPADYMPVKALLDTMNMWIDKYHIDSLRVMNGECVEVCDENGDTLHLSFLSEKEIREGKAKSAEIR